MCAQFEAQVMISSLASVVAPHAREIGRALREKIERGGFAALFEHEASRGFEIELSHLSLIGRCATCRALDAARSDPA